MPFRRYLFAILEMQRHAGGRRVAVRRLHRHELRILAERSYPRIVQSSFREHPGIRGIEVHGERDAERHAVLHHPEIPGLRDVVVADGLFVRSNGDAGHIIPGNTMLRLEIEGEAHRNLRWGMAGVALDLVLHLVPGGTQLLGQAGGLRVTAKRIEQTEFPLEYAFRTGVAVARENRRHKAAL